GEEHDAPPGSPINLGGGDQLLLKVLVAVAGVDPYVPGGAVLGSELLEVLPAIGILLDEDVHVEGWVRLQRDLRRPVEHLALLLINVLGGGEQARVLVVLVGLAGSNVRGAGAG